MAVSKRLRFEILRRDNHQCRYCGAAAPDVKLTIDHVVPTALGGSDEPSNLVAACGDCNAGKSSVPADAQIVDGVAADAVRWAAAMNQVAETRAAELDDAFAVLEWFVGVWEQWTNWRDEPYDCDDAPASIPQFIRAGLTKQEIRELVAVAMRSSARDKWRYFCGCCWKRIGQNRELAAKIVARDAPPPGPPLLTTVWTSAEIEQELHVAVDDAAKCDIDMASCVFCPHVDLGHCGDPVCAVQYATTVSWLAIDRSNENSRQYLRDEAVMAAAEAAMDG